MREEGRRSGEEEATPIAPAILRMLSTSASSIFDASAAAPLSSRPEVGGTGVVRAVGVAVEIPLRLWLEGRRPLGPSLRPA